jgi:hypothetical protein
MAVPYDLTLTDGSRRELYGPWRVDAAVELIRARAVAGRPLHVAAGSVPCLDPYGVRIDPADVVAVADRRSGAVVPVAAREARR